jgi:hypothetical protein
MSLRCAEPTIKMRSAVLSTEKEHLERSRSIW